MIDNKISFSFTLYSPCENYSYTLSNGINKGKIWICAIDGEGGDFSSKKLSEVLYQAVDEFFKSNM